MPAKSLVARLAQRLKAAKPAELRRTIPSASRLAADTAALRRLAKEVRSRAGVRGALRHRADPGLSDDELVFEPAIPRSPVHLHLRRAENDPTPATVHSTPLRSTALTGGAVPNSAGDTGNTNSDAAVSALKAKIDAAAEVLIGKAVPEVNALGTGGAFVPDSEWHDFYRYLYLRDPMLVQGASHLFNQFLERAKTTLTDAVHAYVGDAWLVYVGIEYDSEQGISDWHQWVAVPTDAVEALIERLWQHFLNEPAQELYEIYVRLDDEERAHVLQAFGAWLQHLFSETDWEESGGEHESEDIEAWRVAAEQIRQWVFTVFPNLTLGDPADGPYGFCPFSTEHVNFGLQLVFRQEWTRLGNQLGPILRTIPLGPKQTEKVGIKRVLTTKAARSVETVESTETSRESATTEKGSSEVVAEAASSLNWNIETSTEGEFKGSIGVYSGSAKASLSGGASGEDSSNSRDTKTRMNDAVEKTASRTRNETKIVISTKTTREDEYTRTSEITNPNEEIAITYVYARLYRKYEIHSYLAEANSVIFVPEPLPEKITAGWVRRYAWVLSRALLDDSFRDDLAATVNEVDETETYSAADDPVAALRSLVEGAETTLTGLKTLPGQVALPDIFSGVGKTYVAQLDKNHARSIQNKRRAQRFSALKQHIEDNVLHYMRAIWNVEDPQRRMQRYAKILAPAEWIFVPEAGAGQAGMTSAWPGEFVPVTSSKKPVSELIDPAGPIGYAANYAIFYARSDARTTGLNLALQALRAQYVRYAANVEVPVGAVRVNDVVVMEPHWTQVTYEVTLVGAGNPSVIAVTPGGSYPVPAEAIEQSEAGAALAFEGIVVFFDAVPANAQYRIGLHSTGELQDPELPILKLQYRLPPAGEEAPFFEPLLSDMRDVLDDLAIGSGNWASLDDVDRERARRNFHRYLLRKEHTRRFVLDTNSVTLDLDVGETPALEAFKRLHRSVDVAKVIEEYESVRLDNLRRSRRMFIDKNHADPDIERVTVVGPAEALVGLVGADLVGDDNE